MRRGSCSPACQKADWRVHRVTRCIPIAEGLAKGKQIQDILVELSVKEERKARYLNGGDVLSKSLSQEKDPDHLIKLETFYPVFAIAAQAAAVRSDFPTHSALYHRVSKITRPRGATLVHFGDEYDLQSDPEIMSLARKSEVHPTGAENLFSTRLRHLGCTGGSCRTDGLTRKRLRLC